MRDPAPAAIAALLLLAGCAAAPARDHAAAPLFRAAPEGTPATDFLAALPAKPVSVEPVLPPAPGARRGVSLEVRFAKSDGTTVLAPRITAFAGQRANVQVIRQTAYVADFDVTKMDGAAIAEPVIGMLDDGVHLGMVSRPGEGGVLLSWDLRIRCSRAPMASETFTDLQGNRCTIQLPTTEISEAAGVRALEPGVWGLLARLPDGSGGTIAVTARAETVDLEFSMEEEDARDIALVAGVAPPPVAPPAKAEEPPGPPAPRPGVPSGVLEVHAVTLRTDLPQGSVIEAAAAADADVRPLDPGSLAAATQRVPGARVACLLDEAYVREYPCESDPPPATVDPKVEQCVSGLRAEVGEDGAVTVAWTTTPRWDRFTYSPAGQGDPRPFSLDRPWSVTYGARVAPTEAPRLVVLAPLQGGRAAGVLLRFRPE